MNKTKDEVADWVYQSICEKLDVSVIVGLQVIDYRQLDNILDVDCEFYVFEPTNSKEYGLFEMTHGPNWTEYFPNGISYEREKSKYVFDSNEDCENLGESGYLDLDSPYDSSGAYYLWDDPLLPENIVADLFDYNVRGSAGIKIVEHFELFNKQSKIPECIPKRIIPHLKKTMADYPSI